jgi:ribosomal protein S18 acetylase RimI-like enzyme
MTGASTGQLERTGVAAVHYYSYEVAGVPVGEAQLHVMRCPGSTSTAWLWSVEVYPQFRCRGYGGEMVLGLLHQLRQWGFRYAALFVDPENRKARDLYERLGFVAEGEDHRGLQMRKEL